ncbi:MAG: O-antigen ligase family protein [Acidobacteria bacterium]|nr:O-antigen ligase family protein [Acidobacteriota bacterium]
MLSDKRIDRIAAALAAALAAAPLLPTGLTYLGWPERGYVELMLPALASIWLVARITTRTTSGARIPTLAWDLLAGAAAGAAVYGLMADNPVSSPVFARYLREDVGELFRPMHMTAHPLYSLRMGLTFLEGWLAFRLVASICRLAPDPRHRAQVALAGWVAGLSLVSAFALVQYVTRFSLHPYFVRFNPSLVRTNSTLDDPNTLGAILVLGVGLLAGLLRLAGPRRRTLWAGLLALLLIGIVTTMSRSALGAVVLAPLAVLAIGPAPVTVLQRRLRSSARLVVAAVLVAVVGSMALRAFTAEERRTKPSGPVDMLVKTFDPRESTGWVLRGRLPWWQAAVAMFEEHRLVGTGLGRYPRLMAAYGGGPMRENTHNLFLQMLAEAGIIGFSAFALLCASVVITLGRGVAATDGDDRARAIALGALMGTLAFLLTLLTGHALLLPSGQILFASFVALTLTIARPRPSPVSDGVAHHAVAPVGPGTARRSLLVVGVLGVASIAPAVGLARDVAPRSGPWGFVFGLHDEEQSGDGERYRWTTDQAVLDLAVPNGATTLVLRVTAVYPVRAGIPTLVRLTAAGTAIDVTLTSSDPQTVRLPLQAGAGRVVVRATVSPTFVPPAGSGDTRVLGAQIFLPAFEPESAPHP